MKIRAIAIILVALGFSFSASAGNNPRIDQALLESLAEKKALKAELKKRQSPPVSQINSRYRAVEILEVGDELGGFANTNEKADRASKKSTVFN